MALDRPLAVLNALQQGQRGALMPWSAVALGLGVGFYFALAREPGLAAYALALALGLAAIAAARRWREGAAPLALGLALIVAGFMLAGLRAHAVAGPVLDYRFYGAIEGRVVAIDRSASDAARITLDRVRLDRMAPDETPHRVRVSLHGDIEGTDPVPGAVVMLTGHLGPPSGPAEPGGFDFQRHAWFLGLGAVGYTRAPVMLLEPRAPGAAWLFHARMRLSDAIRARIPGQEGAFAAAVLTGDRSGLDRGSIDNMRDANIAHLLAISGLHMGLLTGFIYGALRFGLALIPAIALRYPIRKWAALVALVAGAFYLALSGGNVATERAFIQVAVMFLAVLLDRRAITLRSVAIAALIVLAHRPETLMSPGFQMSFAATAALVGVFAALRDGQVMTGLPGWLRGVAALVISSAVAGAATAPFAAAHFNQIAVYGLVANLMTVPVMGSVVIPAAVVALLLWPLGLSHLAFWVMEAGLRWILRVASEVAAMPGAVEAVPAPPAPVLGLISLGALLVLLWQGRARWAGVVPVLAALWIWAGGERPGVLIADTGRLVGVTTPEGRTLSRDRGDGFVARIWLENDGDRAGQPEAAARPGWRATGTGATSGIAGLVIWHGAGLRAARGAAEACTMADIVVISEPGAEHGLGAGVDRARAVLSRAPVSVLGPDADPGCLVFDATLLQDSGALALTITDGALEITPARARQGDRLWTR
ncbi:MAG: ComEC family competence protein [Rhodobacteraceae bacterium]|nr:ComEC family competence protein [Paracoccaceae bacterium]